VPKRPELEPLGTAIRALRERTSLSQERLAAAAGLDRTFVGGIERAERNVSFLAISRLLDSLGATWEDLGSLVDAKAREVLGSVGQVGDARMLLMAALLIADEHNELAGKAGREDEKQTLHLRAEQAEGAAADMLESAAKRLEDIAVRLAHA